MKDISRRTFIERLGLGGALLASPAFVGCSPRNSDDGAVAAGPIPTDKMEMRENPNTHDKVSLLGYGCMRWPTLAGEAAREGEDPIDQEEVNRLVDFAIEHGVNYFDTSPAYCKGKSEEATGIALARHDRSKYFIATKMSNFAPQTWPLAESIKMYHDSLRYLQTDHIDYMLLHCIGMHSMDLNGRELDGMETLHARFLDNGILDYLVEEKKAGRVRNLGFSYHGDIEVYDYLLKLHDEGRYHWDFVQIQLNYIDWTHAKEINERNTNGEYLLGELNKRGIPAVIMEPLLGGRLAKVPDFAAHRMKQTQPTRSIASWAFRYAGTVPGVLTVLSGMTYMDNLEDNLRSYAPLEPCSDEEMKMLYEVAQIYVDNPFSPCTGCKYCMPCPYGIDIPTIFTHYNRCINEDHYGHAPGDPKYREARRAFLVGYDRSVPKLRQANHCIGCGECKSHCPQRIDIPTELHKIDDYVEALKQSEA